MDSGFCRGVVLYGFGLVTIERLGFKVSGVWALIAEQVRSHVVSGYPFHLTPLGNFGIHNRKPQSALVSTRSCRNVLEECLGSLV